MPQDGLLCTHFMEQIQPELALYPLQFIGALIIRSDSRLNPRDSECFESDHFMQGSKLGYPYKISAKPTSWKILGIRNA